jgi:hypothetical protein
MSTAEDILYQAYNEGIRAEVFIEVQNLRKEDPKKYKYKEFADIIEEAYNNVKGRENKKDE